MIPQIKKILYTTDLTKNSTYAFYYAIDLARKHDATIIILHCVESLPTAAYSEMITGETFKTIRRDKEEEKAQDTTEIRQLLQQFCKRVEAQIGAPCVDLVSEIIIKEGHPVEEILNTADMKECDVIVLGTHGKGWLKHTFLGSVASSVLARIRKPVFVIPLPSEKITLEESKIPPQIERILYTTDLTENSLYAFYFAVDLAREHGASITILHCLAPIPAKVLYEEAFNPALKLFKKARKEEEKQDAVEIKEEVQQFCQSTESQIGVPCVDLISEIIVKEGHPMEEILNTADMKECDVIILGTHGKGWLKHDLLGSVASSVLERTRKPVFVIPLPSEKSDTEIGAL